MSSKWRPPERLRGKRYANLLRCSTMSQADTSPEQQRDINNEFAAHAEMVHRADIWGEGVSASKAFARTDLSEVVELWHQQPFDVLLVHDYSRFSRSGIKLTNAAEAELAELGIEVFSVNDALPEDGDEDDRELMASITHHRNRKSSRATALAASRGLIDSLRKGRRPAAGMTPYGLDREFSGPEGPRVVTRWDGDEQVVLDAITGEERARRRRPPRRKPGERRPGEKRRVFAGYQRQPDETVRLVPGDPERVKTVHWIFEKFHLGSDRWGYERICQDLHRRGILSPFGGRWCVTAVKKVLLQPAYVGVEIRYRQSNALMYELSKEGPKPVKVNQAELKKNKRLSIPIRHRPRDDWEVVDIPHLAEFLPEPVRSVARKHIMMSLDAAARKRDTRAEALKRNRNSPYVLAGHLRSKLSGHTMRGHTTVKPLKDGPRTFRYYFDGACHTYATRGIAARRIRAEGLEAEVLGAVADALDSLPDLADRVRDHVRRAIAARPAAVNRRSSLLEEQKERSARYEEIFRKPAAARRALAGQIAEDERRLQEIEEELRGLDHSEAEPPSPDAAAVSVLSRLAAFRDAPLSLPLPELKQVIRDIVHEPTIDPKTLELSFDVGIPAAWMAVRSGEREGCGVRPGCTSGTTGASWTNLPVGNMEPLTIARYRAKQGPQRRGSPPEWARTTLWLLGENPADVALTARALAPGNGANTRTVEVKAPRLPQIAVQSLPERWQTAPLITAADLVV